MLKKICLFLASFLLLTITVSADDHPIAQKYADVGDEMHFLDAIEYTTNAGVTVGYADGTFGYNTRINRAELTKIVVGMELGDANHPDLIPYENANCFPDMQTGEWYEKYVCYAKDQGWVQGYPDGNFKPSQYINFVEAMKIVLQGNSVTYPENDIWYKGIVDTAASYNGIPLSITAFDKTISRSEFADMIARREAFEAGNLNNFLGDDKSCLNSNYDSISDNIRMSMFVGRCDAPKTKDDYQIQIEDIKINESSADITIHDVYLEQGWFYQLQCTESTSGTVIERPFQYPVHFIAPVPISPEFDQHFTCTVAMSDLHTADENNHLILDLYKSEEFTVDFPGVTADVVAGQGDPVDVEDDPLMGRTSQPPVDATQPDPEPEPTTDPIISDQLVLRNPSNMLSLISTSIEPISDLNPGEKIHFRCLKDGQPDLDEMPEFFQQDEIAYEDYPGVSYLHVAGVDLDTDYQCYSAVRETDGSLTRKSEILEIHTQTVEEYNLNEPGFANFEPIDGYIDLESYEVVENGADNTLSLIMTRYPDDQLLADDIFTYCYDMYDYENPVEDAISLVHIDENTFTLDGLKKDFYYACFLSPNNMDGRIFLSSEIIGIGGYN
ncbi:S-layer homology domain-containing protein [Patescibacteria group bacterium]